MKLSQKERDILACIELRADMPIEQIRKETGYRDHTIRYAIKQLSDRGVITRIPFINLGALGYIVHNIFFSIGSDKKSVKTRLLKELRKEPNIIWMAEMGAEFQYALAICAKHIFEVHQIMHGLSEKFGNIFFQKTVSSQFGASLLPRNYLSGKKFKAKPLQIEHLEDEVKIDELDDRILSAIAVSGDLSHRKIAQTLQVPLSTFELRVKKLREKGVIAGYFYGIDASSYNYQSFKLVIYARGINPSLRGRLIAFAAKHPNMIAVYECFGSWDYEVNVEVPSGREVVQISQEIYDEFGDEIINVKVASKFADLKVNLYPAGLDVRP